MNLKIGVSSVIIKGDNFHAKIAIFFISFHQNYQKQVPQFISGLKKKIREDFRNSSQIEEKKVLLLGIKSVNLNLPLKILIFHVEKRNRVDQTFGAIPNRR